jgi:hypothetical protein
MSHPASSDPHHTSGSDPGPGKLVLLILAFVVIGIPVVAFVWDALNHLFAGDVTGRWLLTGLVGLIGLGLLLALIGRTLMRLERPRYE